MINSDTQEWIPTDAYLFFPTEKEIKNVSGARLIFDGNMKFDDYELKMIEQFKAYAKKNGYTLDPMWRDNLILRFLQANGFKMEKTLNAVKEHTTWRLTKLPTKLTDPVKKFLEGGYLYVHGRDHKFRPIVVFNAYMIDVKTFDLEMMMDAITFYFTFLIETFMLPGQVENWIFITDLKGMGLTSLPLNPIRKLMGFLQHNYRGRLYAMYIINTPSSVYVPWQMVKSFLEEATVKKIQFLKKEIPEPLFEHTNREQVEKKYGGSAQNVSKYWPPNIPSDNYFRNEEDSKILITKEEYRTRYHQGELSQLVVNMLLIEDHLQIKTDDLGNVLDNSVDSSPSRNGLVLLEKGLSPIKKTQSPLMGSDFAKKVPSDPVPESAEDDTVSLSKPRRSILRYGDSSEYDQSMDESDEFCSGTSAVKDFETLFMEKSGFNKKLNSRRKKQL